MDNIGTETENKRVTVQDLSKKESWLTYMPYNFRKHLGLTCYIKLVYRNWINM